MARLQMLEAWTMQCHLQSSNASAFESVYLGHCGLYGISAESRCLWDGMGCSIQNVSVSV